MTSKWPWLVALAFVMVGAAGAGAWAALRPNPGRLAPVIAAAEGPDGLWDTRPPGLDPHGQLLPGMVLSRGITVTEPAVFGNLAVFAVHGTAQSEVSDIAAVHQAVAERRAEIREVGRSPYGSEVLRLVVRNDGDDPMLILGGTMFRGGHQDRLLTHDLVVAPNKRTPVAVHCAERDRWSPLRAGIDTKGRFEPLPLLAGTKIWTAAHYERDQERVWQRVADVNRVNRIRSMTGSLLAALNDAALAERRDALAAKVLDHFEPLADVVGMAYAVNGDVRVVRTFANQALFRLFRETLSKTAAHEAITAKAADELGAERATGERVPQSDVREFIAAIRDHAEQVTEDPFADDNVSLHYETASGYGTTSMWAPGATVENGGRADTEPVPVTTVFVAKL